MAPEGPAAGCAAPPTTPRSRPEGWFLALALPLGGLFLFLTPPFRAPDEEAHFYRAFQISEGVFIARKEGGATGGDLPRGLATVETTFRVLEGHAGRKTSAGQIRAAAAVPVDPGCRAFMRFSNTANRPPLIYLPQALGIRLARALSPSVLAGLYAGRLANLLAASALFALAIRRTPVLKWAFFALALTPMSLFLTASLSSDAMTNALAFLVLAQVLRCAFGPGDRATPGDLAFLLALGVLTGLTKQAYFPLVLSYFLIPIARLGTWRRYAALFGVLAAAVLIPTAAWALVVRGIYSPVVPGKVDPAAQWSYVCSHPGDFGRALLRGLTADLPATVEEYVGVLGALDVRLPAWLPAADLTLVALAAMWTGGSGALVRGRQALLALGVALVQVLFLFLVIHLFWDKVGPTQSIDVQGRYFIPVGPLLVLPVAWVAGRWPAAARRVGKVVPGSVAVGASLLLLVAAGALHRRYFQDSPADAAERAFDSGQAALRQPGQAAAAVGHFREAVRLDPRHAAAHFNLAILLGPTDPHESVGHYRAAIAADPRFVPARVNLANALARQGRFGEAIEQYREALKLSPDDPVAARNLARALADQEKQSRGATGTGFEAPSRLP
jgi:uncharacterized membrane protein/Tfp pilus assembly protein PilF